MACLPLYWSVFLVIAAICGQQTGSGENITTITDVKLSVVEEGQAQFKAPQIGNVSAEVKDQSEAKILPATDIPVEDPQVAAKQIDNHGLKTPPIVEPDALKKDLGGKCSTDADCLPVNNTNCKDKVCVCNDGFIPSKHSLDKCVKVPGGLLDICEEDAQCNHAIPGSECRDGQCQCPFIYIFKNNRCWEKQLLGGLCNITEQCEDVNSAICTQGVCECHPPLIPSPSNKCLKVAGKEYKAACEEDIQCSSSYGDEARCSHAQCRCSNNYHYNGTTCIVDKKLGDFCKNDSECEISEIINEEASRICLDNKCTCAIGYSSLSSEDICTKSSGNKVAVSLSLILCIMLVKLYNV